MSALDKLKAEGKLNVCPIEIECRIVDGEAEYGIDPVLGESWPVELLWLTHDEMYAVMIALKMSDVDARAQLATLRSDKVNEIALEREIAEKRWQNFMQNAERLGFDEERL